MEPEQITASCLMASSAGLPKHLPTHMELYTQLPMVFTCAVERTSRNNELLLKPLKNEIKHINQLKKSKFECCLYMYNIPTIFHNSTVFLFFMRIAQSSAKFTTHKQQTAKTHQIPCGSLQTPAAHTADC